MKLIGQELIKLVNESDLIKSYCGIPKEFRNICHIGHNTIHQDLGNGKKRGLFYGTRKFKDHITTNMLMNFSHEGVFKHLEKRFGDAVLEEFMLRPMWKPALLKYASFNPDAGTGSTTVDGMLRVTLAQTAFSTLRNYAGQSAYTGDSSRSNTIYLAAGTTSGQWTVSNRGAYTYDTSSIGSGQIVTDADMQIRGATPLAGSSLAFDISVCGFSPAANNNLTANDFGTYDWSEYTDSRIARTSWNAAGYNTFTFNDTGKEAIAMEGITKIGMLTGAEIDNSSPTWASGAYGAVGSYFADNGSLEPTLNVTWEGAAVTSGNMFQVF